MNIRKNARILRKNMTYHEKKLWFEFLKNHRLKWRRQHVIGGFILDFYCSSVCLGIELDGSQHYTDKGIFRDKARSIVIEKRFVDILRFSNYDIDKSFESVCEAINYKAEEIENRLKPLQRLTPLSSAMTSPLIVGATEQ